MIRKFSYALLLLLMPGLALADDDQAPEPPAAGEPRIARAEAPPTPSAQAPEPTVAQAPAPPKTTPAPQGVRPVSPDSSVTTAIPLQPTSTILVPAQTVLLRQEAPKVYIVQDAPATVRPVTPAAYVAPAPAQSPTAPPAQSVTPVAVVREKSRFCRALGALGTSMSGLGQPKVTMGVANMTEAPATTVVQSIQVPTKTRYVIAQPAPTTIVRQQAPAPSPQTAMPSGQDGMQMMEVRKARWWEGWRR
jgi:hypothetical protein